MFSSDTTLNIATYTSSMYVWNQSGPTSKIGAAIVVPIVMSLSIIYKVRKKS